MIYLDDLVGHDMGIKDTPWQPPRPKPPKPQSFTDVAVNTDYAPSIHNHTDFYNSMALIPVTIIFVIAIIGVFLCRD